MSTDTQHPASIAVWEIPSPVVTGSAFTVVVGTTCSAGCPLTGRPVTIRDSEGHPVGVGRLGETPWPGTAALYATKVTLPAPSQVGVHSWTVRFSSNPSDELHGDVSAPFSFRTAPRPEHSVRVVVKEQGTASPLENVEIRLGVYRASTDARGEARLDVPRGTYDAFLWKLGYDLPSRPVKVTENVTLQYDGIPNLSDDPNEEPVWM